jgi:hypothetical protein
MNSAEQLLSNALGVGNSAQITTSSRVDFPTLRRKKILTHGNSPPKLA